MKTNGQNKENKNRRKSGAQEARSFMTLLFAAAPSASQAPGDRLPADSGQR